MTDKVKPPLFTLRGHDVGVAALEHRVICDIPYLISGDEDGTVIIWNLSIFRISTKYSKLVSSRIQSLKLINLDIGTEKCDVLVVQSRDNGVLLLKLTPPLQQSDSKPIVLESFSTVESLFSRGDAVNIGDSQAILAYPSVIENHLVTIRILGKDAKTQVSGTAQRNTDVDVKHSNVFDIVIEKRTSGQYLLFVAYEDGCLSIFSFSPTSKKTVPVLNTEGLKIVLIKNIDLKIAEFISAFDVIQNKKCGVVAVCGSPLNKLNIILNALDSNVDTREIALKRPGTSAIAIRPDCKLFAVASWDATVRLYSMKSLVHLADIKHHLKQVQSLIFIEKPNNADLYSKDNSPPLDSSTSQGRYLLCCASIEGTISISAIY